MLKNYIIIVILLSLFGCLSKKPIHFNDKNNSALIDSTTSFKNIKNKIKDSLAFELCQIYGLDQGIRNSPGFKNKAYLISSIDSFNFKRIVDFIKIHGVPNAELVGKENFAQECVQAAYGAVLLHNPHRLVNEKENLDFFVKLVEKGQLKQEALLLILDKYYWAKSGGKEVLYGSQFGKPCIQNKEKTNQARLAIGAPVLADSLFKDCSK